MKKTIAQSPAVPVEYELADVDAIQALMGGNADDQQQLRALKWIVERAAGTYDSHYYQNERDTSFALGKAWVGQQIVKLTKLNVSSLRRAQND